MDDYFAMDLQDEQKVEVWNLDYFMRLGFSGPATVLLQGWGIDPHDAERLLYRDGVRTKCSYELALEILKPDLVAA